MIWITEDDKTCLENRIQKIQITKKKQKFKNTSKIIIKY